MVIIMLNLMMNMLIPAKTHSKFQILTCRLYSCENSLEISDIDMPTEPQYLRIAVDNGRADTIKKLERLFTEFWKLEEPSEISL